MPYYVIDTSNNVIAIETVRPPAGSYTGFRVLYSDLIYNLDQQLTQAQIDAMQAVTDKRNAQHNQISLDLTPLIGKTVQQLNNTETKVIINVALYRLGLIDTEGKIIGDMSAMVV